MEMKCIQVKAIGSFEITSLPVKPPQADEVLIKVEVTGLCRTDLKLIRVGHRDLVLPRIPGEEVVGVIVEKGARSSALNRGPGLCLSRGLVRHLSRLPGGRTEPLPRDAYHGVSPGRRLCRIFNRPGPKPDSCPAGLPPERAVFAEPLSCCLNALELAGVAPGMRVGIWGAGPAGTLLARAAQARGAQPVNIDPDPRRSATIGGHVHCPERPVRCLHRRRGRAWRLRRGPPALLPRGRLVVFSGLRRRATGLR